MISNDDWTLRRAEAATTGSDYDVLRRVAIRRNSDCAFQCRESILFNRAGTKAYIGSGSGVMVLTLWRTVLRCLRDDVGQVIGIFRTVTCL